MGISRVGDDAVGETVAAQMGRRRPGTPRNESYQMQRRGCGIEEIPFVNARGGIREDVKDDGKDRQR
ncbi:hypothetical protein GUJ93_ZPchr0008g12693 [Zizania palustris]|uniref:Uncharacterized protein n=1 Tax=Zizania palustris TaxID=103762 RepID=A0A8J5RQ59_ZIZPA|nr:hypothetical protein GUJ93_ZPchr0008g12693 [Zizania palustris]